MGYGEDHLFLHGGDYLTPLRKGLAVWIFRV